MDSRDRLLVIWIATILWCFVVGAFAEYPLLPVCEGQTTKRSGRRGCFHRVYVKDGNRIRALDRRETGHKFPGTGHWGEWQEVYCPTREEIRAKHWGWSSSEWPKPISDKETRRLIGSAWFPYFTAPARSRARRSEIWNLTGDPAYDSKKFGGLVFPRDFPKGWKPDALQPERAPAPPR